jgi:hypothetical protein
MYCCPALPGGPAAAHASKHKGTVNASGDVNIGLMYEPVTPSARSVANEGSSL